MYYFDKSKGTRVKSESMTDIRRKAIIYLRSLNLINVVDINSENQGYMGNIYKAGSTVYIWSPSKGKRLNYPDQTYMGYPQSYVANDGSLERKVDSIIAPFNVYRK